MKRLAFPLLAALLILGLAPGWAVASTFTVDQSNTTVDDFDLNSAIDAQTFTAGMYGPLDSVELYLGVASSATVSVTLAGVTGNPPVPNGTILATKVLGVGATPGAWTRFDFSSPAILNRGQVYSLIILPTDNASLFGSGANLYPRGRALTFNAGAWATEPASSLGGPADWAFKTEMGLAAPTPTPTRAPTHAPVVTAVPTSAPTAVPTATPAPTPTATPTASPSPTDSAAATDSPAAASTPLGSGSGSTGSGTGSTGSSDMTIPILAALILVLVLLAGGVGLMLGRRKASGAKG